MGKIKGKKKTSAAVEELKNASPVDTDTEQVTDAVEAGDASIEQVRDILFGAQMRDLKKKFARLEESMIKEVTSLRDETRKRFDTLESSLGKKLESLTDRLKTEENIRAESVKELSGGLQDANKSLEKQFGQLNDHMSKNSRELQQQILDQYKNLSDEIRQKNEETSNKLEQLAQELCAEKVDLSTLSELFAKMALRLNENLTTKLDLEFGRLDNE